MRNITPDGSASTTATMLRELRRALTPPKGIVAVRITMPKHDDEAEDGVIIDLDDSTEEQETSREHQAAARAWRG